LVTNTESIVLRFVLDTLTHPGWLQGVKNEVYRIANLLVSVPRRSRLGVVPSHKAAHQVLATALRAVVALAAAAAAR
jgi:hypothetical protein